MLSDLLPIYIDVLKKYSEEQIRRKPSSEEWSLRQLYSHLIISSKDFYLPAVVRCIDKSCEFNPGGKTLPGFLIIKLGWMPPFKFRVIESQRYTSNADWNKKQIEGELVSISDKLRRVVASLPQADLNYKVKHQTLGWLNAAEWLQTDYMHYKHHLRQLRKIEKWLTKSSAIA